MNQIAQSLFRTAAILLVLGAAAARGATVLTATFQEGDGNGYAGTADTWTGNGANNGNDPFLYFGRKNTPLYTYNPAIRFDNAITTLPANSFILKASLTLTRSDGTAPSPATESGNLVGGLHRPSGAWTESSTSIGTTGNRYTHLRSAFGPTPWPNGGVARSLDITPFARGWKAGTIPNNGVSFQDSGNLVTDLAVHSSEAATVANRPMLSVQYVVPDANEQIVVLSGTSSLTDTWINSALAANNTNYGAANTVQIGRNQPDGGGFGNGLIRFDVAAGLTAALGATYNDPTKYDFKDAYMGFMYDGNQSNVNDNFEARPLSAAATWTEGGATWNTRDGANAWPAPWVAGGVPAGANVTGGPETLVQGALWNPSFNPSISGMNLWDVDTTVENYIYGFWANNGWVVPGYSGTSGNLSGPWSSEGADFLQGGPFLIVIMEQIPPVPEPSTLALLGLGTIGLAIRQRRRRTAA